MNYAIKENQTLIRKQFYLGEPIDICVVSCNRLVYLQKCIWSIVANTTVPHRIFVIDDNSKDGSQEWLANMLKRNIIHKVVINKINKGTAWNFNHIINKSSSKAFVMTNEDMYFHRYWDIATIHIINKFSDAGLVSFYNYTRYGVDEGVEQLDEVTLSVPRTGLGACLIVRELFDKTEGFILPEGHLMGFFATPFCVRASKVPILRNKHYATIPYYATHMDIPSNRLSERESLEEYGNMRKKNKRAKGS